MPCLSREIGSAAAFHEVPTSVSLLAPDGDECQGRGHKAAGDKERRKEDFTLTQMINLHLYMDTHTHARSVYVSHMPHKLGMKLQDSVQQ